MRRESTAVRALRWILTGLGLALPVLALVPLGSLWLWQHGLLLYWAIATCTTTILAWGLQRWLLAPRDGATPPTGSNQVVSGSPTTPEPASAPALAAGADPGWTPAEQTAWLQVRAIAEALEPDAVTSRDDALALAQRTVEAVARELHPTKRDRLLQFTAPEALALVERVSSRMNGFLVDSVPLGDRLTIAQLTAIWRARGVLRMADKAYDVWRVIRMLNPAAAATSEIRERLSKEMVAWGKAHILKRLLTTYVEEVGRAAIDLYGGRMRVASGRWSQHVTAASTQAIDVEAAAQRAHAAEPLRILVAGQVSAGKSSLVNALADEVKAAVDALPATNRFTPYRLQRAGLDAALLIDSPGITTDEVQRASLLEEATTCDLVLWVMAANRADREIDRQALAALQADFAANPSRRPPPVLVVLTHVDRLRPFQEWQPPYDLTAAGSAKASSIRAAIEAVAAELELPATAVIPASLATGIASYNIDALWAAISAALPDAERARLVRMLRDAEGGWDWRHVWSQARSGGRVLFDTLR